MNIIQTIRRTIALVGASWQESLLMAVFLIPAIWGVLNLLTGDFVATLMTGLSSPTVVAEYFGGFSAAYSLLVIGGWIWVCFAGVIFFQAFESHGVEEPEELGTGMMATLTGSLLLAAIGRGIAIFLVSLVAMIPVFCFAFLGPLVVVGYVLAYIPIIYVWLGLMLVDVYVYRGHGFDSFSRSWSDAAGERLRIFAVVLVWYLAMVLFWLGAFAAVLMGGWGARLGSLSTLEAPGMLTMVVISVILGVVASFLTALTRAMEYSIFEALSRGMPYRRSPSSAFLEEREFHSAQAQPAELSAPRQPLADAISVDTEVVNLIGLTKPPAERASRRQEAIDEVLRRFAEAGVSQEQVRTYLEGHWFPTTEGTWDDLSDESVRELAALARRPLDEVHSEISSRLEELE